MAKGYKPKRATHIQGPTSVRTSGFYTYTLQPGTLSPRNDVMWTTAGTHFNVAYTTNIEDKGYYHSALVLYIDDNKYLETDFTVFATVPNEGMLSLQVKDMIEPAVATADTLPDFKIECEGTYIKKVNDNMFELLKNPISPNDKLLLDASTSFSEVNGAYRFIVESSDRIGKQFVLSQDDLAEPARLFIQDVVDRLPIDAAEYATLTIRLEILDAFEVTKFKERHVLVDKAVLFGPETIEDLWPESVWGDTGVWVDETIEDSKETNNARI